MTTTNSFMPCFMKSSDFYAFQQVIDLDMFMV